MRGWSRGLGQRSAALGFYPSRVRAVSPTDGVDGPNGIEVPRCGRQKSAAREPPAMSISMIGIDTAKSTFQLHGIDATGKVQLKRKLRRDELIPFFEQQPRCTV